MLPVSIQEVSTCLLQRTLQAAAELDMKVPALDSVVFHDEINAARPAQIVSSVYLVIVVAPAFIHPSIDVGEQYRPCRALVRRVKLEFPSAVDLGLPRAAAEACSDFCILYREQMKPGDAERDSYTGYIASCTGSR